MIHGSLTGLGPLLYKLTLYESLNWRGGQEGNASVEQRTKDDVLGWLKIAEAIANDFEMKAVHDRIEVIKRRFQKEASISWDEVGTECRVLRETIDAGFKGQLIYRYPNEQARLFMRWMEDWQAVREKFPSAVPDIKAAVDCWALYYATASVFHSMRVLEYGLAALAGDVGITITTQSWQNVIDQIESRVRGYGKSPNSPEKLDRLRFLSEAAKEMVYFKDGWRNHVSHNRATYDEFQARSVMEHVRGFMTAISARLSEVPLP